MGIAIGGIVHTSVKAVVSGNFPEIDVRTVRNQNKVTFLHLIQQDVDGRIRIAQGQSAQVIGRICKGLL